MAKRKYTQAAFMEYFNNLPINMDDYIYLCNKKRGVCTTEKKLLETIENKNFAKMFKYLDPIAFTIEYLNWIKNN